MDIPYHTEAEFLAARSYDAYLEDLAKQAKDHVGAAVTAPRVLSAEEQLRQAQTEAAQLREALRKEKKKRRSSGGWTPAYPSQHRGY